MADVVIRTILLAKSNRPLLFLSLALIPGFAALCLVYDGRMALGGLAGVSAVALFASALLVKKPKAKLEGTILTVLDTHGGKTELDLESIAAWEVLSDVAFDQHPRNSIDDPGLSMEFGNGCRVIARC